MVQISNRNLDGINLTEIPGFNQEDVVCSHLKRGEETFVPKADSEVRLGDVLHLVGESASLKKMRLIIGDEVDVPVTTSSGEIRAETCGGN